MAGRLLLTSTAMAISDLFVGNDAGGIQFFENTAVSSSASITIAVNNLNGNPVASLDEFSAKMGDTITGNLITGSNGTDPTWTVTAIRSRCSSPAVTIRSTAAAFY